MRRTVKVAPECPVCKSKKTGYMLPDTINKYAIKRDRFLKGERVRFYEPMEPRRKNCFCVECDHRWSGKITKTKMTRTEYYRYLEEYGFISDRNEYYNGRKKSRKEKRRKLTTKEKEGRWDKISSVLAYTVGVDIRKLNPYTRKRLEEEYEEEDIG